MSDYPYTWAWGRCKMAEPGEYSLARYKGTPCRVLVRGRRMNSCLVEFEDGYRAVTSRNGIRRRSR